jgi:transcriptional regulator with XRE-family HTH domain
VTARRTQLGRLLQVRRQAAGLSRTRVGAILDIPPGTIEGWELGRVAKPPVHDVLRLARLLGISPAEVEAAVLEDRPLEPDGETSEPSPGAAPLLDQAFSLFAWSNAQAPAALQTTPETVAAWRSGERTMTLPETMSVAALIGLHAAGVTAQKTRSR